GRREDRRGHGGRGLRPEGGGRADRIGGQGRGQGGGAGDRRDHRPARRGGRQAGGRDGAGYARELGFGQQGVDQGPRLGAGPVGLAGEVGADAALAVQQDGLGHLALAGQFEGQLEPHVAVQR